MLSGANAIINKVVPVNDGWKCYLHTDDGDKAITNDWLPGDQALCQTFNIKAGVYENVSNTYYWRCVSEVGQKTANEEAYIVITADEAYCDKNVKNDAPKAGDNVVLCRTQHVVGYCPRCRADAAPPPHECYNDYHLKRGGRNN